MNAHMRSNDAYKAAFMNMYAFTELQGLIARAIGVIPGEYIHIADSFHIYGSYFDEFKGFLKMSRERSFEDRTYTTEFARPIFVEGCDILLEEPDMPQASRDAVEVRKQELQRAT